MLIGITGAMEEEIQLLKQNMYITNTETISGFEFFIGKLENCDIVLIRSGIGKVNAAISSVLLCQFFKCDYILNTGAAGALSNELEIGDIVIASGLRYHDFDLRIFGYEYGQVPEMPATIETDPSLVNLAEKSAKTISQHNIVTGVIVSGDYFVTDNEKIEQIKSVIPNVMAVEMEGCAIAHVCHRFKVPSIIIRSISDIVGKNEHLSKTDFLEIALMVANNSAKFISVVLRNL